MFRWAETQRRLVFGVWDDGSDGSEEPRQSGSHDSSIPNGASGPVVLKEA